MARLHVRTRKDRKLGLYRGKTCLAYGKRSTILTLSDSLRQTDKERK